MIYIPLILGIAVVTLFASWYNLFVCKLVLRAVMVIQMSDPDIKAWHDKTHRMHKSKECAFCLANVAPDTSFSNGMSFE